MEEKMVLKTTEALVKELKVHVEKRGNTQNSISKKIGISTATMSLILNDKYPSIEGDTRDKIRNFLEMESKRAMVVKQLPFVETGISTILMNVMEYAHIQHILCTIYGDAGVGKTMAAEEYERMNPDAKYIMINPTIATAKSLLEEICEEFNVNSNGKARVLYKRIIERLKGTNKMLILDEAQELRDDGLEIVKVLNDAAKIPIVLMGNQGVYNMVYSSLNQDEARVYSRSTLQCRVRKEDFTMNDIKLIFGEQNADTQKLLYRIAKKTNWALRGARDAYKNASAKGDLSVEGLMCACKMMGIELT